MRKLTEIEVFIEKLRDYMSRNNLNIKNLADILDMPYSTVRDWFNPKRKSLPKGENIIHVCKCLHLDVLDMLGYTQPESTGLRDKDQKCIYLYKTFPEDERDTVNAVVFQMEALHIKAEMNKSNPTTAASNVTSMESVQSTNSTKKSNIASNPQYGKQVADKPKSSDKDYASENSTNPGIS